MIIPIGSHSFEEIEPIPVIFTRRRILIFGVPKFQYRIVSAIIGFNQCIRKTCSGLLCFMDHGRKELLPKDISEIIQIVDTDGAYIPDECVVLDSSLSEEDSPFYKDDKIACLDVDKIVKRNEQKSENLDYLSSCTTIKVRQKTVPYSVYYVSCNLDHYLHRSANLDYRMKRSLADTFARTYIGDVEGFIKEISDDPGAVKGMSYDESWNYIKEDKNSLHRHTNLNLLFEKLIAKAES